MAEKAAQASGITTALRGLSSKGPSKNVWELHKKWSEAGATRHRRIQDMGYNCCIPRVKPLLNQRQRPKFLTYTFLTSSLGYDNCSVAQWSFAHLIWKSMSQSLEEGWRGTKTKLLEVQCEVSSQ